MMIIVSLSRAANWQRRQPEENSLLLCYCVCAHLRGSNLLRRLFCVCLHHSYTLRYTRHTRGPRVTLTLLNGSTVWETLE